LGTRTFDRRRWQSFGEIRWLGEHFGGRRRDLFSFSKELLYFGLVLSFLLGVGLFVGRVPAVNGAALAPLNPQCSVFCPGKFSCINHEIN